MKLRLPPLIKRAGGVNFFFWGGGRRGSGLKLKVYKVFVKLGTFFSKRLLLNIFTASSDM